MFLKVLNPIEKQAFYSLANCVMIADNIADNSEKQMMWQFLQEMELPENEVILLSYDEAMQLLQPSSDVAKRQIFAELWGLALCDELDEDDRENTLLRKIGKDFGFNKKLINNTKEIITEILYDYNRLGNLVNTGKF